MRENTSKYNDKKKIMSTLTLTKKNQENNYFTNEMVTFTNLLRRTELIHLPLPSPP